MSLEVQVAGNVTALRNISSFSVQEDATPIEPSSSFGGVGRIAIGLRDYDDSALLIGKEVSVTSSMGKTSGYIKSVSSTDGSLDVSADSVLGLFNTERTVSPFVGTLGDAIQEYCDLVNIANDVVVDPSITGRAVVCPGWRGNVWVGVKQFLSAQQVEMALVFNRVYVRPLRALIANTDRTTTSSWSLESVDAARSVTVNYFNNEYGTQKEVYPLTAEDPSIYQVSAGEKLVVTQQLDASLFSVNQPTASDWVDNTTYAGTDGVYAVVGNDGLPVTAAQWLAQGGSLTVAVTDDPSIIEITITGASMTDYSPYRIAMSSGSSNFYNALHITGTAVVWSKKDITIPTGATDVTTSDESGVVVDNPFISSLEQAYSLGMKTAGAYAGLRYTVSGTALALNRDDGSTDLVQATIADFNAATGPGVTIATFNATWTGSDISDFNAFWQETVDNSFGNQFFGNAVGSRVLRDDANFRITSATTGYESTQFDAELDTTIDDFNNAWPYLEEITRTNLFRNPSVNTLSLLGAWWGTGGAGTATLGTDGGWFESTYWRSTWTTGSSAGGGVLTYITPQIVPTVGLAYSASGYVRSSRARTLRLIMTFLNAAETVQIGALAGTPVDVPAGVWTRLVVEGAVAPAGAKQIRLSFYDYVGAYPTGDTLDVDAICLEQATTAGTFFCGSTVDAYPIRYDWTGTAHASTSTKTLIVHNNRIADFNTQFAGYSCGDFSIVPLRRT